MKLDPDYCAEDIPVDGRQNEPATALMACAQLCYFKFKLFSNEFRQSVFLQIKRTIKLAFSWLVISLC